ncbi:MAG TPA: MogA/MoaB family molybdenum cofactor biosynthesis protein [Actinomycetota bacterium]|nr:MogA/MoaB family molybdenum cofactor biosynthesis protein [Actinomycetota bacterium]
MNHRAAVVTVSDSASSGQRVDESGPEVERLLGEGGIEVAERTCVPDDLETIRQTLLGAVERDISLVVTTGGTGLGPRDVTPEATRAVIEREAPGLAELMRIEGIKKTPHAALSRAVVGTRAATLIVNLPGSVKAVREDLEALLPVLPHALDTLSGETEHRR